MTKYVFFCLRRQCLFTPTRTRDGVTFATANTRFMTLVVYASSPQLYQNRLTVTKVTQQQSKYNFLEEN